MDEKTKRAARIVERAYAKYSNHFFGLEVLDGDGDRATLRLIRYEQNGQIRDLMERRQKLVPAGVAADELRYAAFVFGSARAAAELAARPNYNLWFDDVLCLDLMRLDELFSEDEFFRAALDVEGTRLEARAYGTAEEGAQQFGLPFLEDPEEREIFYLLWDRTSQLADLWTYARLIRSIGYTPREALFDYLLAILEESLEYPDGWYPEETFELGISGPRIYAAIAKDAVRPALASEQEKRLDELVDDYGWLPSIEDLEALEDEHA